MSAIVTPRYSSMSPTARRRDSQSNSRRGGKRWLLLALGLLMMLGLIGLWMGFQSQPRVLASIPEQWPDNTHLPRCADLPSVLLFADPAAPEVSQQLEALEEAIANERVMASVIFQSNSKGPLIPADCPAVAQARQISGVNVIFDGRGTEFASFGIHDPGRTLVYTHDGHLVFEGTAEWTAIPASISSGAKTLKAALTGYSRPQPVSTGRGVSSSCE